MRKLVALAVMFAALASASSVAAATPSIAGGKFEVTCKPHAIPDQSIDPIVSPGAVSAHLHTFFGNKGLTSMSTPATLQADGAGTTCVLSNDTAAYWIPAACDGPCIPVAGGDPERGPFTNVVPPVKIFAYYFGTKGVAVGQYPTSLAMVGGNAHATAPPVDKTQIAFACGNGGGHSSPVRTAPYDCTAANGVKNTDGVVAIVKFPYCLDAAGAVAYGDSTGTCPAGTTTLGQVQIHAHYGSGTTGYQAGSRLNFSSGPYWTLHGDWSNGWDQAKLAALVSGCLDVNRDCGFVSNANPGPAPTALADAVLPHASSCSDSWGSDGHSGPWFVGTTQTLHGNTVVITCPSGGTAWKVHYQVIKEASGGGTPFYPIDSTRSGTGSTSFSINIGPIGCNVGWLYTTHVHNSVTGGDIYKPPGGEVIC